MDRRNSRKRKGRITINLEASGKIQALFSQESDTSLVFSAAEHAANEKGETTDHATSSASTSETNFTNTCVRVISLPKIVNTPPPNHGNGAEKKDAGSGVKRSSPPPIKLPPLPTLPTQIRQPLKRTRSSLRRTPATNPNAEKCLPPPVKPQLIPTQQFPQPPTSQIRQLPKRIQSSVRRTPANPNAEKPAEKRLPSSTKPQLIQFPPLMEPPAPMAVPTTPPHQLERIRSASLERKVTFMSPPATNDDPHYSDDFDEEDEDDEDEDASLQRTPPNAYAEKCLPPPIKPQLIPTQQFSQLPTHQICQPPKRIQSSVRRTPANTKAEKCLPPPIKPQLIPTQQYPQPPTRQIHQRPKRIQSSVRRTPANTNAKKPTEKHLPPPIKSQLIQFPPPMEPPAPTTPPRQLKRIHSASLERKVTLISPPATNDDPYYSDDFDEEDEDDEDEDVLANSTSLLLL